MSKIDKDVLDLLNNRVEEIESEPTPKVQESEAKFTDFIGFNIESRMKSQLTMQANLDGIALSQWIREVLTMELLRIMKGSTSSREQLIRERRMRSVEDMTG